MPAEIPNKFTQEVIILLKEKAREFDLGVQNCINQILSDTEKCIKNRIEDGKFEVTMNIHPSSKFVEEINKNDTLVEVFKLHFKQPFFQIRFEYKNEEIKQVIINWNNISKDFLNKLPLSYEKIEEKPFKLSRLLKIFKIIKLFKIKHK